MPEEIDVQKLAQDLHDANLVNLDASARTFIETAGARFTNPGATKGWYAIGGDHYVIVCGDELLRNLGRQGQPGGGGGGM